MSDFNEITNQITEIFLKQKNFLVKSHLNSFDDFIAYRIPQIFESFSNIKIKNEDEDKLVEIKFGKVHFQKPSYFKNGYITPMTIKEAHLKNLTYTSNIHVDIEVKTTIDSISKTKELKNILIGKIPLMIGSRFCDFKNESISGYFIINGSDKVIISQERQKENAAFCVNLNDTKHDKSVEIKSMSNENFLPAKNFILKLQKSRKFHGKSIDVSFNGIKTDIQIGILLKCLGVSSDKAFYDLFISENEEETKMYTQFIKQSIVDTSEYDQNTAIEFIGNKLNYQQKDMDRVIAQVDYIMHNEILCHQKEFKNKIEYIVYMIKKLALFEYKIIQADDRDSYSNKAVDSSGIMLSNLFRQSVNKLIKEGNMTIRKEITSGNWKLLNDFHNIVNYQNIYKIYKASTIENSLKYALSTGNWGIRSSKQTVKVGVAQVLQRLNFQSSISHLRRLQTPIDKTSKITKPRKLHLSSFGYICAHDSPEGSSVGLVKNLSLSTYITSYVNDAKIRKIINKCELKKGSKYIFINGEIVKKCETFLNLLDKLKLKRQNGLIHPHTSFHVDIFGNLNIYTTEGRLTRPLIAKRNITRNLKKDYKKYKNFNELLFDSHLIEFIDINEIENCVVVSDLKNDNKNVTHFEINPNLIMSFITNLIVFPNCNPSPRLSYADAMAKQAIGIPSKDFNERFDTLSNVSWYPQNPITRTSISRNFDNLVQTTGCNVNVAILSFNGFNQEDSVILNKSAIENGLFTASFYKNFISEETLNFEIGKEDIYTRPDPNNTVNMRLASYDAIDNNGFPILNSFVKKGDCILGKVSKLHNSKKTNEIFEKEYIDKSVYLTSESGFLDKVLFEDNADGRKFVKIKIRIDRFPIIGDKFASRSAQKGTVGLIMKKEDLPFDENGIVPDLILNPNAIPSRMTAAQLLETVLGKKACENCMFANGDAFQNGNVDKMIENSSGETTFYTNDMKIFKGFNGICYYNRLKHIVSEKINARSVGPISNVTRQPVDGRSNNGGLRIGNMECDVLSAHGISCFQKEKLIELSDGFAVNVDKETGHIIPYNSNKKIFGSKNIKKIKIPYSLKLLYEEINALGISFTLL
tara:strand:- start:87 stop:3359 length:3273 start_codon:yes stop_codon:yes gene_type:complete